MVGWLSGFGAQDWLSRKTGGMRLLSGTWVKPPRLGEGVCAVPRLSIVYAGICLTTEENSRKNLSQGNQRALG